MTFYIEKVKGQHHHEIVICKKYFRAIILHLQFIHETEVEIVNINILPDTELAMLIVGAHLETERMV